ncbi:MAG: ABC transporter substrate-binding protein [Candidatus Zixiibacteriota bacterium]
MKSSIWVFLATIIIMSSLAAAQDIDSDILQVRLNRLYFSHGSEAGIAVGTPYTIICNGDSIYGDIVEFAGEGVSYSRASADIEQLGIDDSCTARLLVAAADSNAALNLGTDMPLELFNLSFETLFIRTPDGLSPGIADSCTISGKEMTLYLNPDYRFSDNQRMNAETIIWWLKDLNYRSRSYPVRFFFAKLLPIDEGGAQQIDAMTLKLTFHQNMPRADYLLSYPDFGVYNRSYRGTGPLVEIAYETPGEQIRAFVRNLYYHGPPTAYARVYIKQFRQSYRMKFEYENGQLDGYFGFGFDEDLAGTYEAKAAYPYIAAMISGIGRDSFTGGRFPTSIYYRFDTGQSHLIYPHGKIEDVFRWYVGNKSNQRYYPFNFADGTTLQGTVRNQVTRIRMLYDDDLLYETGRYLADIVAREGCKSDLAEYTFGQNFDIRLTFIPASDDILPLSLISAVLELNDQNSQLPASRRLQNPGWNELGTGFSFIESENRERFYARADNTVFEDGSFFPLFRPWVYSIATQGVRGLGFDFYGFPDVNHAVKFKKPTGGPR